MTNDYTILIRKLGEAPVCQPAPIHSLFGITYISGL